MVVVVDRTPPLAGLVDRLGDLIRAVEGREILAGPPANLLEPRPHTVGTILPRQVLAVELFEDRLDVASVARGRAPARVAGPAGVAAEAHGEGPALPQQRSHLRVAEQPPDAPQLVVDERVHRVEQQGPAAGQRRGRGSLRGLDREGAQDWHQEALRLARARSRGDHDILAPPQESLERARLVGVGGREDARAAAGRERPSGRLGDRQRCVRRAWPVRRRGLHIRPLVDRAGLLQQAPPLADQAGVADVVLRLDVGLQAVVQVANDALHPVVVLRGHPRPSRSSRQLISMCNELSARRNLSMAPSRRRKCSG